MAKTTGYSFPDLSLVNSPTLADTCHFSREKLWRAIQQVVKVYPNFSALDIEVSSDIWKKLQEEKAREILLFPRLASKIFPHDDFDKASDLYRAVWVSFLQAALPYQLAIQLPSNTAAGGPVGDNRMLATLLHQIKRGKQRCSSSPDDANALDGGEQIVREEVHALASELMTFDSNLKRLAPALGIEIHRNVKIQKSIQSLEKLFSERTAQHRQARMYQLAVEFASKHHSVSKRPTEDELKAECIPFLRSRLCTSKF